MKLNIYDAATFTSPGGQSANEDAVFLTQDNGRLVAIVADGLGRHGGGDIASSVAVEVLYRALPVTGHIEGSAISRCFAAANDAVLEKQKSGVPMKSTAVMLILEEGYATFAHMGDSRGYAFRGGQIVRQTVDHSVSQMAVLRGDITPAQIRFHKSRNKLLYVLGVGGGTLEELTLIDPPLNGDAFLLCSDGFWEYVNEDEMEVDLVRARSAEDWLSLMLARIQKRVSGDHDNLSAIAVVCRPSCSV